MSASAPSSRPFGPYILTRAIGTDPLGDVWRGGTAGAPRLRPFLLFHTFTSAAVDRTALLAAMETAVHVVEEVTGPAVARGCVLGVIDDVPFLAVEYVEGRTLDSLFAARVLGAAMPIEHGLLIAERLLTALEAGAPVERDTGAAHGFLVPAFVSVSNEGESRVFGYGLGAGLLTSLGAPRARQAFAPYLAPEVLASGKPGTPGDLYGVGAILFEALTGKPPFPGVALESIDAATLAVDGTPVPEDVRRLLRRALHPDPATRDRDVAVFRRDLSALLYGGPYAPSTFNFAFFLQKYFERAIQREKMEIAAEEELDPAVLAASREARAPAEATGRRRVESSGSARKPDATGPSRKVESSTGSRRAPVVPPAPVRPAPARGAAPLRTVSGLQKRKPLGGVPVWAVALGGAAVLAAGGFFALRPTAKAPAPVPTPAPRPTAAPTPAPTPAPVVVGKDDPLFQAAVQKKLGEELKKQEAHAAKQQDAAAKKKQADIEKAAEGARNARETDDAARAAREKSDREEAGRLAREAAAKRREEARAGAALEPAVKEGDLVDVEACDTPPVSSHQVRPVVPQIARQRRVSGTVLLRILVDETGKPEKVEILRDVTPNVGLGAASRQALEQWRWKPAMKNGVNVKTWIAVQVPFRG